MTLRMKLKAIVISVSVIGLTALALNQSNASENAYQDKSRELGLIYEVPSVKTGLFNPSGSLDDYLAYAALNNQGLTAAYFAWVGQLKKAGYMGALPDPKLTYGYFLENVETRVGPQEQRIGLRQTIPWFGSLGSSKDIALEGANAAYQKFRSLKLALFYKVKSAYYDYYYLGRNIQLTSDNIELLKLWEAVARAKYKAGLRQYSDVLKAQVELGMLVDKLETLQASAGPLAARLRATLNLAPDIEILSPVSIPVDETPSQRDLALQQARDNNPDISALVHRVDQRAAARRLAGKKSYPNFTLGVDYIETGQALNPTLDGSGKDPLALSVGINLPIWFGKNKARKDEAQAALLRAQYTLSEKKNRVVEITEMALFRHEDALRKIHLYRDGLIPKAQQSLNASYTAYEAGKADFFNVLDAQRMLLSFQLRYDLAITELANAQAELAMLTGIE